MESMFDWLLGLETLRWAQEGARLGWRHPLPGWGWVLVAAGAVALGAWSYSRLQAPRWARVGLGLLRSVLLVALVVLLAGPVLVLPQEKVEPDTLVVLVDRSASLQIKDVEAGTGAVSREQALREALARQGELFGAEALGHERRVLWLGFGGQTFELAADQLGEPQADRTAIRTSLQQALQRVAGQPVSGVVLLSDGRTAEPAEAATLRLLQQQAVPVFSVPLGAEQTPTDLAVGRVEAPDKAFINDSVPVRVWVDRYPDGQGSGPVTVRLVDPRTDQTLDQQRTEDLSQPVRLTGESAVAGPAEWRIEVESPGSGELIVDNNRRSIALELVDRPIRLLYIDGYPRWEYRYLKNMLVRDSGIDSSVLLISADTDFAQEGNTPLARFPASPEELEPFDVIVLGDVPADYFGPSELALLRDHVARRGAGLLWIAGERSTPTSYEGTPLAELLPMRKPGLVQRLNPGQDPLPFAPTAAADAMSILRLRTPGQESPWPADLPMLYWAQQLGTLKPAVDVLASAHRDAGEPAPLLVRMSYGSGQVLYLATDETWRWRFGRGDLYFDQFWTQLVQMLGRSRLRQGSGDVWLNLSHRRVAAEQPVVIRLHVRDPLLLQRSLPAVKLGVFSDQEEDRPLETLELRPLPQTDDATGDGRVYEAIWRPTVGGRLTLRPLEAALAELGLSEPVEVILPDDELRQPATDHAHLAYIAEQTGGQVVDLNQMASLQQLVPNRARRTPIDLREPLWDSPLALILIVSLLTFEWVGRKLVRLV